MSMAADDDILGMFGLQACPCSPPHLVRSSASVPVGPCQDRSPSKTARNRGPASLQIASHEEIHIPEISLFTELAEQANAALPQNQSTFHSWRMKADQECSEIQKSEALDHVIPSVMKGIPCSSLQSLPPRKRPRLLQEADSCTNSLTHQAGSRWNNHLSTAPEASSHRGEEGQSSQSWQAAPEQFCKNSNRFKVPTFTSKPKIPVSFSEEQALVEASAFRFPQLGEDPPAYRKCRIKATYSQAASYLSDCTNALQEEIGLR